MNTRALLTTLALALSLGLTGTAFAKNCTKGKPCGNACISKNDVCHKDAVAKTKNCKKGKPCGNACISEKATCHTS